MTAALARRAGLVIAVEIDQALFPLLEETLKGYDNVQLVKGDARQVDFQKLLDDYAPGYTSCKVMGNLPYYITSPLIIRLLQGEFHKELLVFMVQKEVAQRITAQPGRKDYSSLSVVVQYFAQPEMVFGFTPCLLPTTGSGLCSDQTGLPGASCCQCQGWGNLFSSSAYCFSLPP